MGFLGVGDYDQSLLILLGLTLALLLRRGLGLLLVRSLCCLVLCLDVGSRGLSYGFAAFRLAAAGKRVNSGILGKGPVAAALEAITPSVAVEVGEGFGIVSDHRVEIKSLRVGEIGVGDGNRGPIR